MFKLLKRVRLFDDDEAMWILARRPGLLALSRQYRQATRQPVTKVSMHARSQPQSDTTTPRRRRSVAAA